MILPVLSHSEPRDPLLEILASRHSIVGRCEWGSAFSAPSLALSCRSHAFPVFSRVVKSDPLLPDSWKAIGCELLHSNGDVHAVPTNPPGSAGMGSAASHRCCSPPSRPDGAPAELLAHTEEHVDV